MRRPKLHVYGRRQRQAADTIPLLLRQRSLKLLRQRSQRRGWQADAHMGRLRGMGRRFHRDCLTRQRLQSDRLFRQRGTRFHISSRKVTHIRPFPPTPKGRLLSS